MKTRKLSLLTATLGLMFLTSFAITANAQLVNGGFETGDSTGWIEDVPTGGFIDVTGVGSLDGEVPFEGAYFANLKTNGPGSFTTLSQPFNGGTGTEVSGYAYFFDAEFAAGQSCTYLDSMSVDIMAGDTVVANVFYTQHCPGGSPGDGSKPWTLWSYTFDGTEAAGPYKVRARIVNVGDAVIDSTAGLDGIGFSYAPASPGIANGSFEQVDEDCSFITKSAGVTTITNWTIGLDSVDHICTYWAAAEGDQSLDMSGALAGSVSQTLSLDDGHTYKVTFQMAGNDDGGSVVKSLNVDVGGAPELFTFDTTGTSNASMGWVEKEFLFVASSASATLTFTSLEANGWGPALDDVKLFFSNHAPTAVDDPGPTGFSTDEDTAFTTGDVTTNDDDSDGDPLTVCSFDTTGTVGNVIQNGNAFDYDPNGQFEGLGTGEQATDTFTYQIEDPYTGCTSNFATVTITINGVNDAPYVYSVSPTEQDVQYSDYISTVTVVARDVDSPSITLTQSGSPVDLDNESLTVNTACAALGDGSECSWDLDGQINYPGVNDVTITFTPTDDESLDGTTGTHVLHVYPEDATVTVDSNNPVGVDVTEPGGTAQAFTLSAAIVETVPDEPDPQACGVSCDPLPFGNLNEAVVTAELHALVGGGFYSAACDHVAPLPVYPDEGYSQVLYVDCVFPDSLNIPVNTYHVEIKVDGATSTTRYYTGLGEDVLTVFDPSLGFTTAGGWFHWPGTCDTVNTEVEFDDPELLNLTLLDGTSHFDSYGISFEDETFLAHDSRCVGAGTDDRCITTTGGSNNKMTVVFAEPPLYVKASWVTISSNDITAMAYDPDGLLIDTQSALSTGSITYGQFEFSGIGPIGEITFNDGTGQIAVGLLEYGTECAPSGYAGDKTNFGWTMKYGKKGDKPKGSMLMIRHTESGEIYRVKSNALFGLAIGSDNTDPDFPYGFTSFSGKAVYSEPGWIDPEGNHVFILYAEDAGEQGCNQDPSDRLWIEVQPKAGIIYNAALPLNLGPDAATGLVPINCGNIFIPHETGKKGGGGGKPE